MLYNYLFIIYMIILVGCKIEKFNKFNQHLIKQKTKKIEEIFVH